jgi:hypothetical protein
MAYEYLESLPERETKLNEITIFTDDDQNTFRKELYADDNPLWILYDSISTPNSIPPDENV